MILKAAVLTASDRASKGLREDESGPFLRSFLEKLSLEVVYTQVLPDDLESLKKELISLADERQCDLILTTGGTGLSPRDCMPEATRSVIEKEIPGIMETIRHEGSKSTPLAILSRGLAGLRGKTLVINLPGSPRAVREAVVVLEPILPHALEVLKGWVRDCHGPQDKNPWSKHSPTLLSRF